MFEDLEKNPLMLTHGPDSQEDIEKIKSELTELAPDFVEFIEKFGRVDIDDGYFTIYSWIEDLARYFTSIGLEKPDVDAWVFGDNGNGDFAGIDKNTGKIIQVSSENSQTYGIVFANFNAFIRHQLEDE